MNGPPGETARLRTTVRRDPRATADSDAVPPWVAVALGAALLATYLALPRGFAGDIVYTTGAWGAVLAVGVGLRRHRPARPAPWYLLAVGLCANACGEVVALAYRYGLDRPPSPGPATVLWVSALALLAAAFVRAGQISRDGRRGAQLLRAGGLLDVATVTAALALPMWVFLVRPAFAGSGLVLAERLAVATYSGGTAVLAALALGLLTRRTRPTPTLVLLAAAGMAALVSVLALQVLSLLALPSATWVGSGLLVTFTLAAAAALHPSMAELGETDTERPGAPDGGGDLATTPSPLRMALLGGAVLVAPASVAVRLQLPEPADAADGWAFLAGGALVSLLVLGRMAGLLAHVHAQAQQLATLAGTDALTELPNRRTLEAAVTSRIGAASRQDGESDAGRLALVMLDLDHFKVVNDTHGHPAGDALLQACAQAWRTRLRAGDVLARMGGEEFAALLPATSLEDALQVAEQLRLATPQGMTVSAGVAAWRGDDGTRLLARADRALYRAKRTGRDRVSCDDAPEGTTTSATSIFA